jgi:hypothetical protein
MDIKVFAALAQNGKGLAGIELLWQEVSRGSLFHGRGAGKIHLATPARGS